MDGELLAHPPTPDRRQAGMPGGQDATTTPDPMDTTTTRLRVLLVEDDPAFVRLLGDRFATVRNGPVLHLAKCLAEALEKLDERAYDAVLLDLNLPDSDGLDTFVSIAEAAPDVAVVVLTGYGNTRLAERAVRLGAQDYIPKDVLDMRILNRAIRYAVRRQRRLLDLEAASAAQLEGKNRFLSQVSHDLRTPLAVIHSYVSLIQTGAVTDPAQRDEFLGIVLASTQQLSRMINDLLEQSRLAGSQLALSAEPMDLLDAVVECVAGMRVTAARNGVDLSVQADARVPNVLADRTRVMQVMFNLLDNAVKFTPDGGTINVSVLPHDGGVAVTVSDSGPGIEPDNLKRVFDQYFQENPRSGNGHGGLGLGLYVCRQLVELHGGHIEAQNNPAGGATFVVWLPGMSHDAEPREPDPDEKHEPALNDGGTVQPEKAREP